MMKTKMMAGLVLCLSFTSVTSVASGAEISVGTQNLWHYLTEFDRRVQNMEAEIKAHGIPDLMGFQEASVYFGSQSLFSEFLRYTGFYSSHRVTNEFVVGQEGIGIASRFEIIDSSSYELPNTSFFSRQAFQHVSVRTPDGLLNFVNLHLSPFEKNHSARVVQVRAVARVVETLESTGPVIIVGDFNDSYDSGIFGPLMELGYFDVNSGKAVTYDPQNPYADGGPYCLDYVLFKRTEFDVVKTGFLFKNNPVSDHYGVWARLRPHRS